MAKQEFAEYLSKHLHAARNCNFYTHWDEEKNPEGPQGLDGYVVSGYVVAGNLTILANAQGGGASFCCVAPMVNYTIAGEFQEQFCNYLASIVQAGEYVWVETPLCKHNGMISRENRIRMGISEFADLLWDHEDDKAITFSADKDGSTKYAVSWIRMAHTQHIICESYRIPYETFFREITDENLDFCRSEFCDFLRKQGFKTVWLHL